MNQKLSREDKSLYTRVFHGKSKQKVSASTYEKNRRATLGAGRDISAPALHEVDLSMAKHDFSSEFCSLEKKSRYTRGFFEGKLSRGCQQVPQKKWKGHPWRAPRYKRPRPSRSRDFGGQRPFFVENFSPAR